jgi:glycosyltransferase involved in cell wall biosynthesis
MKLCMTHGYMLSGSGSNVYVQNLCRGLVKVGHDVHLLCQEPEPLRYDFVNAQYAASERGVEALGKQETPYAGYCAVYGPDIGDLLPVYVYDDYPGWRVKTFLDLDEEELERYVSGNVAAVQAVLEHLGADGVVTNHSVPGPEIARIALEGTGVTYTSVVHGSALQYVARRSERYMKMAGSGLSGATSIVALSSHSAGTIAEDFPQLAGRTLAVPGGVDTDLFRPDRLDLSVTNALEGGPGRGPEQTEELHATINRSANSVDAGNLARHLAAISASYEPRKHDRDAGKRIREVLGSGDPIVIYLGKLIHSKGVHSLLSAFARMRQETGARLLVIGYGTFREGLEALVHALSRGNRSAVEMLVENGRLFEGGPASPMEHFEVPDELLRDAEGMEEYVEFVGPLYHEELSRVLPAVDVAVVPSIFPETFGLVAAEFGASGVPPFVADHSGLREAGSFVGKGLPFDPRVSLKGSFEENLARALTGYLSLPEHERRKCRETVERNAVEDLSWGALAERIAELAAGS